MKLTHINNESGQVAIEYILLMVVVLGAFLGARNLLISTNAVGNFVQKPWQLVAGMIETGVWGEPKKTRAQHPGLLSRHRSFKGDGE
ncbi:MAG: hypothetical protein V4596_05335 [Bdellovibrionota bacterium]